MGVLCYNCPRPHVVHAVSGSCGMPADRPRRRPDERHTLPVPLGQRCQATPTHGQPGCLRRGFGKPRRLCGEHREQYKTLYAKYKKSSWQVERLDDEIAAEPDWVLTSHWDGARVDLAISLRTRHINALTEEITEREKYENLFIEHRESSAYCHIYRTIRPPPEHVRTADEGHVRWLDHLRAKRERSATILAQLRRRAEELARTREHCVPESPLEHVEPSWQARRREVEARRAERTRVRRAQVFQRLSQEEERRAALDETHRRDETRRQQFAQGNAVEPYSNVWSPLARQSQVAPVSLPGAEAAVRETAPLLIRPTGVPIRSYTSRTPPVYYDLEGQRTRQKRALLQIILLGLVSLFPLAGILYALLFSRR
ncbi:hypothetical protein GY45DRAFT_562081 [Cubamyces sp. BRFM 1775]|nr:hypothetical protein GY45DRAFT_562081 [Cubamyces sp. BRFM 1775]